MKRFINYWSSMRLKIIQIVKETVFMDPIFLVSFIISSCILKYYFSMDSTWIIKFLYGYLIGTIYNIYKNNNKINNEGYKFKESVTYKLSSEIFTFLIIIMFAYLLGIIHIEDNINGINYVKHKPHIMYFMGDDGAGEGDTRGSGSGSGSNDGNGVESGSKDGIAINISKEGMVEGGKILGQIISDVIPSLTGAIAAGKVGAAMIKNAHGLSPLAKGALGVGTAVGTAGGIGIVGHVLKSQKRNDDLKNVEEKISQRIKIGGEDEGMWKKKDEKINDNIKNENIVDESSKVPSILEDEMSPLYYLLNYNLILGVLILLHIIIIFIILGYKYEYIPVRKVFSNIINIILRYNDNILKKYEEVRNKLEIIGFIYLNVLLKINIIFIIFDVLLIIYINYDLVTNLDSYVIVHNKLNSINYLLIYGSGSYWSRSNHGRYVVGLRHENDNGIGDLKGYSFNTNIKRKINIIGDSIKAYGSQAGPGTVSGREIGLRDPNQKINYSVISGKKISESIYNEVLMIISEIKKLPKLSEVVLNKDEIIEMEISDEHFNDLDNKFSNLIISLIMSKLYITKGDYLKLVKDLNKVLNELGLEKKYLNKIHNIIYFKLDNYKVSSRSVGPNGIK